MATAVAAAANEANGAFSVPTGVDEADDDVEAEVDDGPFDDARAICTSFDRYFVYGMVDVLITCGLRTRKIIYLMINQIHTHTHTDIPQPDQLTNDGDFSVVLLPCSGR